MGENGFANYSGGGKNGNGYSDTEKIHGKPVKIGKGTGKRVAKKATGAISNRRRRMMEELEDQ